MNPTLKHPDFNKHAELNEITKTKMIFKSCSKQKKNPHESIQKDKFKVLGPQAIDRKRSGTGHHVLTDA